MLKSTVPEVLIMQSWKEHTRLKTNFLRLALNVAGLHYKKKKNDEILNKIQAMQVQSNREFTPLEKVSVESEIKILICDMNNASGSMLVLMLAKNKFKNVVFQPDITELKKQVYY